MNYLNPGVAYLILLMVTGCMESPDIEDVKLDDRVKACSAGFSSTTKAGLDASVDQARLSGSVNGQFREQTKSMIFNEIPETDRLKAYEDYIACVESNWNK